jgi:hypothetical protein
VSARGGDFGLPMSISVCMVSVYTRTPLGCKGFDSRKCSIGGMAHPFTGKFCRVGRRPKPRTG